MNFFKQINKNTLFKSKKSIFKIIAILVITIGLISSIANLFIPWPNSVGYSKDDSSTYDIGDMFFNWVCYFTTESNLFILISFIALWLRSDLENKKGTICSYNVTLAFCSYITITFLVYNLVLLPSKLPSNGLSWFETIVLHMIAPLLYIFYFIVLFDIKATDVNDSKNIAKISYKKFLIKDLYKFYIYPILWFIFVELRGLTRHFSRVDSKTGSGAYLYFFLDPFNELTFLIIIFFVVFVVNALLSIFYVCITNAKINKLNKKNKAT